MNKELRIKELIEVLNKASEAYYASDKEIMSNFEYDALYDELVKLEEETGIILSNSPTVNVGYDAVDYLPKVKHEKPMLSLSKTKDRNELKEWLNGHDALLSWKMDGLTVVLEYRDGELYQAVTRGNGEVGELITANARCFINIPLKIAYKEKLIVRGEAVITYSDFEKINASIDDADAKYKNPRNLCSGSVRQLSSKITKERSVRFYAFNLVTSNGEDIFDNKVENQFEFLKKQGFDVVEYKHVSDENILDMIQWFQDNIADMDIPSDGLVLTLNDIAYGKSLGMTAKYPRSAIAFKWQDEIKETTLIDVEWSASRTGLINPVAIFDTIDLEGTNVSRASLHNISYIEDMKLGIGDKITVYKANMIIPQLAENLSKSSTLSIPKTCPVCGGTTEIREENASKMLYCTDSECPAKKIKSFAHFVERNSMNIEGLSEATLEKFINYGYIKSFKDLYHLDNYKDEIINLDGFGEKSYLNIIDSVNKSRDCNLANLIAAVGIEGIGLANAKVLAKAFDYNIEGLIKAEISDISQIDGIGDVLAKTIYDYMRNEDRLTVLKELIAEVNILKPVIDEASQTLTGKTFVITGSLNNFVNRDELKALIEDKGGKVSGSVSNKTYALINNDNASNSSKNKKAKELGVRIITEEEFMNEFIR